MTTAEEREGGPLATADAAAADVWALVADPRYPRRYLVSSLVE
jgi:hypothetical protein